MALTSFKEFISHNGRSPAKKNKDLWDVARKMLADPPMKLTERLPSRIEREIYEAMFSPVMTAVDIGRVSDLTVIGAFNQRAMTTAKMQKVVVPPRPTPSYEHAVEKVDAEWEDYMATAAVLGFETPEIAKTKRQSARDQLIGFCLDQGMPIYNNTEVHKYMTALAEKEGPYLQFVWKSLSRDPDANAKSFVNNGEFLGQAYDKPIPIDMLKRAVAVKKQFPEAKIYVSDYQAVNPDPFICAKLSGCEHVIFGMWDEPGFKAVGRDAVAPRRSDDDASKA